MRAAAFVLALTLLACGGAGSGGDGDDSTDGDGGCDPACEATIHFVGKVGIPADIDHFTYAMCGGTCIELELPVPVEPTDTIMESTGEDPAMTVSVTRTNEDYYPDLQGVFAFEGTWTSSLEHLDENSYVAVRITRPDMGNIASTARTLNPEDVEGTCGCPTIELDL